MSIEGDLWKTILSKPSHNRLCATCHTVIGRDGGECSFDADHDTDGTYSYACDACRARREKREALLEATSVSYYMDDALAVHPRPYPITDDVRLVCFQCGFEPLVVAVRSYLGPEVVLDQDEAIEIAEDYLKEIGWLQHETEIYVL